MERPAPPGPLLRGQGEGATSASPAPGERGTGGAGLLSHRPARAAFGLVLALALGLRLWGLDFQLPWQFHPDEGHYTWNAVGMLGSGNLNPKYFRNPSLFTYVLYAEYRLLGFQHPKQDPDAAAADGLFRPPSGVAFLGRLTSALLGVGTVAAVGWIGRRLLGPWAGVLSALFLAVAFIHVRDSHYATNDVPAAFLLTLSVAASLALLRRPSWPVYALAGLLGGLATSTKYNAGLFVAPLVAAHAVVVWRAWRGRAGGDGAARAHGDDNAAPDDPSSRAPGLGALLRLAVLPLALAGIVSLLAYLAGTPYTVLDWPKFLADFRTQSSFVGEGWEGQADLPPGVPYLLALGAGMGWAMLGLSLVGLALLARRRPAEALVLAAFPLAYLAFMLGNRLFFVRFALPVVPFLCVAAACGAVLLARMVGRTGRPSRPPIPGELAGAPQGCWVGGTTGGAAPAIVGCALALAAVVQPTLDAVRHNLLIAREDTRVLAARWAVEHAGGAKLLIEEYTIRDRRDRAYGGPGWTLDTDVVDVNDLPRADPLAPLRGTHRYVMVSSFQYERFGRGATRENRQGAFYAALERDWRPVARFSPGVGNAPLPFDLEDLYTPFWDLGRYERPGPTIVIYERRV